MSIYPHLPALNAFLNGTSAILLLIGYIKIRQKQIDLHHRFMLAAFSTSILFLVSYIVYHVHTGSHHFAGTGTSRPIYFALLISHTFLAATVVPLALVTLTFALKQTFEKHKKIAHWTFPIWLYVSVTGVIVYFMLYHFHK